MLKMLKTIVINIGPLIENIETVCIDEATIRRIARLNNLKVTGSIGIIISAI